MSTSWRSPFPILPAPQTTPVSTNPKSLKRPIHNPYDKFTQPEFDEWIGGITSALRRALGEETEEDAALDEHLSQDINVAAEETFIDDSFEDSFANIQSRHAKGKAKDPREGPGLGVQQNPIELLSDSESGAETDEEYEEYEEYSSREAEEFDTEGAGENYDNHHEVDNCAEDRRHCLVDPQVEKIEVEEISFREESPDVIEICSDEEEDTRASVHDAGYRQYVRSSQLPPDEVEDEPGPNSAVLYEQDQLDTEEVADFPPSITQRQPSLSLELPDPWRGPRTYAEDFYAGGDFNAQDQLDGVSPSNLTPVHDAHVDTFFSNIAQDDGPSSGVLKTELVVVNVDVTDEALPDSSPPPSSPVEVRSNRSHVDDYQLSNVRGIHGEHEEPENILDHLYRDVDGLAQDEQQMIFASSFDEFDSVSMSSPQAYSKPTEHLDWNWPPAFPRGKFASRAGHLETSSPRTGVDDVEEAQDDVIDVDAENNEEEEGSEEIPEGPIPLGTSDLGYDTEIHQEQDEQSDERNGVEVVEEDDIQAPQVDQFPPSLDPQLNADERAAVESFFDLLNCGVLPSAHEQVEATLPDISGVVATEFLDGDVTPPLGIEEAGNIMVATDASEPRDGELRSQHPDTVVESFTSIESTPTTEIQDDFDNVTLQNIEIPSAAPTSTLGDSLQEQLGTPNDGFSFSVAEIDSTTPTPRDVSEGIEVASFAGDVSDLDGDYVVEEPPTAEASVEPEAQGGGPVTLLAETVPVTPKPASAEPSSFHNVSAFPMPIFCDPSLADPIISSGTKHPQQTPPRLVKLPDTPHIIISPRSTSGQPTPVSVPVSVSMLHTFSRRVSPSEGSSGPSDLFTPREGDPTSVDTGDGFGTPSPSHADLPLPSSDDVMASVTSALEESRSEIDTITIEVPDNVAITESSPTGTFTDNQEDDGLELAETTQLDVPHLSPVDANAENEIDRLLTEPAARHRSEAEVTTVVSPEFGEVQRADRSTLPTATDQTPPPDHDHPEEALALTEVLPREVLGLVDYPLLSPLSEQEQESLQSLAPDGQVPPESVCKPGEDDSREDTVTKYGLERFTNVPDTPYEGPDDVLEPRRSGDIENQKSQPKPSKRKIMSPVQTSSRLTRSMSSGHKKSQKDPKAERMVPGRGQKRKLLNLNDGGSEHGSASSGASTAAKLIQFTSANGSRASSIVSSAPSDSSSVQHPAIPPPLFHAHGAMHHRHRPHQPLPSVPVQAHSTKMLSPEPPHNPERQKNYSPVSAPPRILSSNVQRLAASTSSPVTRSNCRFHKVSLPKEEGGPRVCFVVPGCSLGDKELMDEEEIQDHGPATYEDYPRLVGNIEALDFNPYLVGILRQLVGVDLIRENEVFFLLQPGEEAQYKKKGRKSAAGSKLAASLSQSATTSPQVSVASRRSPVTSLSRPPVSTAGSIATSIGSSLSEAQPYKHTSSLFSASSEELSDQEGSSPKFKRRRKDSVSDKETRADAEGNNVPPNLLSKGPQRSTHILKRRRSTRQAEQTD
ncbi:hypothetical protein EDD22DRAFT_947678 [Suillus occidentalis]|nr:hypothetical protein EDD22DRAFT_947678 [Suillus occidentalis]